MSIGKSLMFDQMEFDYDQDMFRKHNQNSGVTEYIKVSAVVPYKQYVIDLPNSNMKLFYNADDLPTQIKTAMALIKASGKTIMWEDDLDDPYPRFMNLDTLGYCSIDKQSYYICVPIDYSNELIRNKSDPGS